MTASQKAFQEAALLAKEEVVAEQQAHLFMLQQENHDKEMKTVKEAMESMKVEFNPLSKQMQKSGVNNENANPTPPSVTFGVLPQLTETRSKE